jgi:hypothetical protein
MWTHHTLCLLDILLSLFVSRSLETHLSGQAVHRLGPTHRLCPPGQGEGEGRGGAAGILPTHLIQHTTLAFEGEGEGG